MCTVGDPFADIGTLLAVWNDPEERGALPSSMPTQVAGFLRRGEAAARYCERGARDPKLLPYYVVFGTFKMAVVLQQIYVRYHRGQTRDQRFAGMGRAAEILFESAAARRP
jgi:aminoglycoside phosphotransferase (APT) family kinase protein